MIADPFGAGPTGKFGVLCQISPDGSACKGA